MMLESIRKLMAKPREAHAQLSTPQRSCKLRHSSCSSKRPSPPAIRAGLSRAYAIKLRRSQPISGRIPVCTAGEDGQGWGPRRAQFCGLEKAE